MAPTDVKAERSPDIEAAEDGAEDRGDRAGASGGESPPPAPQPPAAFNINGGVSKSFSQNAESRRFNLRLIRLVRDRPELYDLKCPAYKSATERDRGWKEVASELNQDLEFVRTRWKTMRDRFKKECRKYERRLPVTWTHFHEMSFLQPFFRFKSIVGVDPTQLIDYSALTACGAIRSDALNGDAVGTGDEPGEGPSADSGYPDDVCLMQDSSTKFLMDLLNSSGAYDQQQQADGSPNNNNNHSSRSRMGRCRPADSDDEDGDPDDGDAEEGVGGACDEEELSVEPSADSSPGPHAEEPSNLQLPATKVNNNRKRNNNFGAGARGGGSRTKRSRPSAAAPGAGFPAATAMIHAPDAGGADDDEEDALFCRIMLKKLRKMDEHTKEAAKAKILELLVHIQYGGGDKSATINGVINGVM